MRARSLLVLAIPLISTTVHAAGLSKSARWTVEKMPNGDYAALAVERKGLPAMMAFQCYSDVSQPGAPSDCDVFLNIPLSCSPEVHRFKVDVVYGKDPLTVDMWCISATSGHMFVPNGEKVEVWAWGLDLPLIEKDGVPSFDVKAFEVQIGKDTLRFSTTGANHAIKKVLKEEFVDPDDYKQKLADVNSQVQGGNNLAIALERSRFCAPVSDTEDEICVFRIEGLDMGIFVGKENGWSINRAEGYNVSTIADGRCINVRSDRHQTNAYISIMTGKIYGEVERCGETG